MAADQLKPILEYEQTEDSDLRLEQIFDFLLSADKGEIRNDGDDLPRPQHK